MHRAPTRPVRACFVRQWCTVPKVALEVPHFTLHSSHCTLHTSHFALTLHSPHFISSHLIWALLTSFQLFSSHLIFSHVWSRFFSTIFISSQLCAPLNLSKFLISRSSSQLISALLHVRKLLESERSLLCTKTVAHRKLLHKKNFAHRSLRHRCVYTEKTLHTESFCTWEAFPLRGRPFPSIFRGTFCAAQQTNLCVHFLSNTNFGRDFPQKLGSWKCENDAFVWDIPQELKVEDVKTKLSCQTSLKKWRLKRWKRSWKLNLWNRSFRARLPLKTERWRCKKEAFARDFPQKTGNS